MGTGIDARQVAWETLLAVEQGAFADAELARRLDPSDLVPRDRSLATRLVYGTLAWQGYLDHLIEALGQPVAHLDAPIRVLLRLALFQIERLSRVPRFAAVHTAVELSKRFRSGAASSMVNALLRRYLRERDRIPLPRRADDPARFLSISLSHPRWLVEHWISQFGVQEAEALLAANNEVARTALRVNRLRAGPEVLVRHLGEHGVAATESLIAPDAVVLEHGGNPGRLPGFDEGLWTAQSEASQLVTLLLGAQPGWRILDACAAPGGKSTYLAEILRDQGEVVAVDLDAGGLARLEREAGRLGVDCIRTVHADVTEFAATVEEPFDAVLLDAPCSGLGTLRQHPEIKWRRRPKSLEEMAARQRRLLTSTAGTLRPGGVLVYATCTLTPIENDRVVEDFLAAHRKFVVSDPRPHLPRRAGEFVDERGFFRTFPHRHGLDGFFAVRLQRLH